MAKIEKIDLSKLPSIGGPEHITLNNHTLALERIEYKLNEIIDYINTKEE